MARPWSALLCLVILSTGPAADAAERERRPLTLAEYQRPERAAFYAEEARKKRAEEIAFAQDLIERGAVKGETLAELTLRLADLYFEEATEARLREEEAFQRRFDACVDDPGCDPDGLAPDYSGSDAWRERSVVAYRGVLARWPAWSRADEATYFLANALWELDRRGAAVKAFTRLVKRYPDSRWAPDAYVWIGEHWFEEGDPYKALIAYRKATAWPDARMYPLALYKVGWCYYNVGEYGEAIDSLRRLVALPEAGRGALDLRMKDEALGDLVRFYADAGWIDDAWAYFEGLGRRDLMISTLERLAATTCEQGRFGDCATSYRRLIALAPTTARPRATTAR